MHVREGGGSIWQTDRINVRRQMQDRLQRRDRQEGTHAAAVHAHHEADAMHDGNVRGVLVQDGAD